MQGFGLLDALALAFFGGAWVAYHLAVERGPASSRSLTVLMSERRRRWFALALERDNRIVDAQILGGLQNGTAFFASTSLLAVGGTLTLLRATDEFLQLGRDLPFIAETSRLMWEVKIAGLVFVFAYTFFKFSWSYRLFNYCAILLGALPNRVHRDEPESATALAECVAMNIAAAQHFNRGQRGFFMALAYLGWFLGPVALVLSTTAVLVVMWNRQFGSNSKAALALDKVRR